MPYRPLISKIRCHSPNKNKSKVCNRNYLVYIGTREGVDLSNPALSQALAKTYPEMETLNDDQIDLESSNQVYLSYINERPRSHGLFGNIDTTDILSLSNHLADITKEGVCVYRGIVSLHEIDAVSLGFDQKINWENYMHEVMPDIASQFKIPIDKLSWTAAVHMEKGHPHCHWMMWRTDNHVQSPYIHPSLQDKCREIFSGKMFELERQQEVINKTLSRDLVVELNKNLLDSEIMTLFQSNQVILGKVKNTTLDELSIQLLNFSTTLPGSGRYSYKLLPLECKEKLNEVVEKIKTIPQIKNAFSDYMTSMSTIADTYSLNGGKLQYVISSAENDLNKRIANQVLKCCKKINIDTNNLQTLIPQQIPEPMSIDTIDSSVSSESLSKEFKCTKPILSHSYKLDWSKNYKQALKNIYDKNFNDYPATIQILKKEMENGNVLAMEQLAKMTKLGIGCVQNDYEANQLYASALMGYKDILNAGHTKYDDYISYKIGRFYEQGLSTETDLKLSLNYYQTAAEHGNKYAQFSLANLYLYQKISPEELNITSSEMNNIGLYYLKKSANQNMGYAAHSYAKRMKKTADFSTVQHYYTIAFNEFQKYLSDNPSDNTYYTLGTMYYEGNGTERNQEMAYHLFEEAAALSNKNAIYALGKTCADKETNYYNPAKALHYFEQIADDEKPYVYNAMASLYLDSSSPLYDMENGIKLLMKSTSLDNASANYKLGTIYADKSLTTYDPSLAFSYYTTAIKDGSENAIYALGTLLLDKETSLYNPTEAVSLLEAMAEKGNSFAQLKLGNLFLWGQHPGFHDVEKGIYYLSLAVAQDNKYALQSLNAYNNYKNTVLINSTFTLVKSVFSGIQKTDYKQSISEDFYRRQYLNSKKKSKKNNTYLKKDDPDRKTND